MKGGWTEVVKVDEVLLDGKGEGDGDGRQRVIGEGERACYSKGEFDGRKGVAQAGGRVRLLERRNEGKRCKKKR